MELIVRRVHVETVMMAIVAVASFTTYAYDPSPLQNICVAVSDNMPSVLVNGKACKDSNLVTADDFFFSGLQILGSTNNSHGFAANKVNVNTLPGLNTLGISVALAKIAPGHEAPLFLHPRASELIFVLAGTLYVGFVDSTPGTKSKQFTKILKVGDVFIFPIGLMHFVDNIGTNDALIFNVFNSQDPGFVEISRDVFGTEQQPISAELLAKGFNSQDPGFVGIARNVFGTEQTISAKLLAKGFQSDEEKVEYCHTPSFP